MYKKKDPADPKNYCPLTASNAIYTVYTKLVLALIRAHTLARVTKEQHGGVKGRTTTQLASRDRLHAKGGFVTLLDVAKDVAKAFSSVPRPVLIFPLETWGAP